MRHEAAHDDAPLDRAAIGAIGQCPPPWVDIDRATDHRYRALVEAHGPELLEEAQARGDGRSWLLVRYLKDVPTEIVEASLESYQRERALFAELIGSPPDLSAAETWAREWRAASNGAPATNGRRRKSGARR
jgi:hypothetical protein